MPFTMSCEWDNRNALQERTKTKGRKGLTRRLAWENVPDYVDDQLPGKTSALLQRFVPVPYLKTAYSYSHRESERSFSLIKVRVYSSDCTINADAPRIVFQKEAKLKNIVPKRWPIVALSWTFFFFISHNKSLELRRYSVDLLNGLRRRPIYSL